jgi:uncharacterized DUF497 family protein
MACSKKSCQHKRHGVSFDEAVLFVVETEPYEDTIRIISARPATKKEEEYYYEYYS